MTKRPKHRCDCIDGARPCPWVGCSHHLLLKIGESGSMSVTGKFRRWLPVLGPAKSKRTAEEWTDQAAEMVVMLEPSCALDVADEGVHTLEECGTLYGVTRERIRQIEASGKRAAREEFERRDMADAMRERPTGSESHALSGDWND